MYFYSNTVLTTRHDYLNIPLIYMHMSATPEPKEKDVMILTKHW